MDNPENITKSENIRNETPMFEYESKKYYGVGGWLLLFCIGLTILGPLMRLGAIGNSFAELRNLGGAYPSLVKVVYIENILGLILTAFSVYAGVSLWSIKTNAVTVTKIFLVSLFLFAIFDLLLVMGAGFPEPAASIATQEGIKGVIQSGVYAGIWYAYLCNSQRVQNTYNLPL